MLWVCVSLLLHGHLHAQEQTLPVFQAKEEKQIGTLKGKFTVLIFDKEVQIEKSKILVTDKLVLFNTEIPSVNFASCWNNEYTEPNYVIPETKRVVTYNNVPEIPYTVSESGYHLRIELFNNSFVRKGETNINEYKITSEPQSVHNSINGDSEGDDDDELD